MPRLTHADRAEKIDEALGQINEATCNVENMQSALEAAMEEDRSSRTPLDRDEWDADLDNAISELECALGTLKSLR